MSRPTRRRLLAAAPIAGAGLAAAAPAPSADALLLDLAREALARLRASEAFITAWQAAEEADDEAEMDRITDLQDAAWAQCEAALRTLAAVPARGLQGLAAKVAFLAWLPDLANIEAGDALLASATGDALRALPGFPPSGEPDLLPRHHRDAALLNACAALVAAHEAEEAHGTGEDHCPYVKARQAAEAAALAQEATTLDGIIAMARVAACQARVAGDCYPGGESWSDSYTGEWPERVCKAVLRLAGGEARR